MTTSRIKIEYPVLQWFRIPISINAMSFLLCGSFQIYTTHLIVQYINEATETCSQYKAGAIFNFFIGFFTLLAAVGLIIFYAFLHKWSKESTQYAILGDPLDDDLGDSLDQTTLPVTAISRPIGDSNIINLSREGILQAAKKPMAIIPIVISVLLYSIGIGCVLRIPSTACIHPDQKVVSISLSAICVIVMISAPFLVWIFVDEEHDNYLERICFPRSASWLWLAIPFVILIAPLFLPLVTVLVGVMIFRWIRQPRQPEGNR